MKTVNLELSKQLKEAGYPQEPSEFYWFYRGGDYVFLNTKNVAKLDQLMQMLIASPTADEILEHLPDSIKKDGHSFEFTLFKDDREGFKMWELSWEGNWSRSSNNLADAAAKMWLYLRKEGIIWLLG